MSKQLMFSKKYFSLGKIPFAHFTQKGGQHCFRDNYQDYAYVVTLDGLYQHTLIATGTRLRPVEATFLGHILGTKPAKDVGASGRLRRFYWSSWAS